ncbi:MAG: hypothetical protein JOZ05_07135 [Acetobacteraceae bacterium]|nr:hypothetical protein [Acetobacteraceae bacterium]
MLVPAAALVALVLELDAALVLPAEPVSDCRSSNSELKSERTFASALLSCDAAELEDVDPDAVVDEVASLNALLLVLLDDWDWLSRSICQSELAPLATRPIVIALLLHGIVRFARCNSRAERNPLDSEKMQFVVTRQIVPPGTSRRLR